MANDVEAGGSTSALKPTYLQGRRDDPDEFSGSEIFNVRPAIGSSTPKVNIDAIKGTACLDGVGMVGVGVSGVVGYVRQAPRDQPKEVSEHAGVIGFGDDASASPGVAGFGDTGVKGEGQNFGVYGESKERFGVHGETTNGVGVRGNASGRGRGVFGLAEYSAGVEGQSTSGNGVQGYSKHQVGGEFGSTDRGQVRLQPKSQGGALQENPFAPVAIDRRDGTRPQLPMWARAGELFALQDEHSCHLFVCIRASTTIPATWAQVLLGPDLEGNTVPN